MKNTVNINLPNSYNVIKFSNIPSHIRGTIELDLKAKKFISSLIVKLKAVEELKFSQYFLPEKSKPLNQSLCIVENKELSKGLHKFEFVFSVDPHYTFDKQENCSITQHLKAVVNFKDNVLPLSCKLDLIVIPHPFGDGLIPFDKVVRNFIENLGPFEVKLHTNHLTVGGFIEFQLKVHSLSKLMKIHCIRLKVEQQTTIHSRTNEGLVEQLPFKSIEILKLGKHSYSSNLIPQNIKEGEDIHGKWLLRLPNDQEIRPSYIEWTLNSIKPVHKLKLEIYYSKDNGIINCGNVGIPIHIPHCTLSYDFVTLPKYSKNHQEFFKSSKGKYWIPARTTCHETCSCGKPIPDLKAVALGINDIDQLKFYNEGFCVCSGQCLNDDQNGSRSCTSKFV